MRAMDAKLALSHQVKRWPMHLREELLEMRSKCSLRGGIIKETMQLGTGHGMVLEAN